jgi:hypothetical protein
MHQTIATEHHDIRIIHVKEFVRMVVVLECAKCGHGICPGCGDWCDRLIGPDLALCCEGHCRPSSLTTTIMISSSNQKLLQSWIDQAAKTCAAAQFAKEHTNG